MKLYSKRQRKELEIFKPDTLFTFGNGVPSIDPVMHRSTYWVFCSPVIKAMNLYSWQNDAYEPAFCRWCLRRTNRNGKIIYRSAWIAV